MFIKNVLLSQETYEAWCFAGDHMVGTEEVEYRSF